MVGVGVDVDADERRRRDIRAKERELGRVGGDRGAAGGETEEALLELGPGRPRAFDPFGASALPLLRGNMRRPGRPRRYGRGMLF